MERLTRRSWVGEGLPIKQLNVTHKNAESENTLTEILDRLTEYEETDLAPEEIQENISVYSGAWTRKIKSLEAELNFWKREAITDKAKLGEIKILEEQGLLHKAQVPNGTIIYLVTDKDFMDFEKVVRTGLYLYGYTEYFIGEINKGWFLTREEAEKRIAELESGIKE